MRVKADETSQLALLIQTGSGWVKTPALVQKRRSLYWSYAKGGTKGKLYNTQLVRRAEGVNIKSRKKVWGYY